MWGHQYLTIALPSAVRAGADRLEVCANLGVGGGITPSLGLLRAIQREIDGTPIMVGKFFLSKEIQMVATYGFARSWSVLELEISSTLTRKLR